MKNNLDTLTTDLEDTELNVHAIKPTIDSLEQFLANYLIISDDIQSLLDDEDEIMEDIEESMAFQSAVKEKISRIESRLKQPNPSTSTYEHPTNSKLPELKLPKFSGDATKWPEFWNSFENEIENRRKLNGTQKFIYLLGQLDGEAKQTLYGLHATNENYNEAKSILKTKYDKPYLMREIHLGELFNLKCDSASYSDLEKFKSKYTCHLRGLKSLKENVEEASFVFVEMLKRKLPTKILDNMKRNISSRSWTLEELDIALEKEIEYLQSYEKSTTTSQKTKTNGNSSTISTSFGVTARPKSWKCKLCFEDHSIRNCKKYETTLEKRNRCRDLNLCLNCLWNTHDVKDCTSIYTCRNCNERHHTALCEKQNKTNESYVPSTSVLYTTESSPKFGIALPTALLSLNGTKARGFYDLGSQETLIESSLVTKLDLQVVESKWLRIDGFQSKGKLRKYDIVEIPIKTGEGIVNIKAIVVKDLPHSIYMKDSSRIIADLKSKGILMADEYENDTATDIEIIIGANYYYSFVKETVKMNNVTLLSTPMGMMLSGKLPHCSMSKPIPENSLTSFTLNRKLSDLWTLDSIGITEENGDELEDKTKDEFEKSIVHKNGQYTVQLPWKKGMRDKLQRDFHLSKAILQSTIKRLEGEPGMLKAYDNVFKDYERRGFIEKVDPSRLFEPGVHFLPHHGVKKDSATTPLRVVFNCAAGKPSLNHCLNTGPCLLNDLCQVLLRFRLGKYASIGDISKAFLMIQLDEKDRNSTMFLWPKEVHSKNSQLEAYQFKVVLFGATCSPFLLNATVQHHLKKYDGEIPQQISRNIYVDNVQYCSDSENKLVEFYDKSKEIFKEASMKLCEWSSNSKLLMKEVEKNGDGAKDPSKNPTILGMKWNVALDELRFPSQNIELSKKEFTKRKVLSCVSKLFDPIGFLTPINIRGRKLMQQIWEKGYGWDENIADEILYSNVKELIDEINKIDSVKIKRELKIKKVVSLHAFSDASKDAFGSVIYIKSKGEIPQFLVSKAKVTPLSQSIKKKLTIPKLELTAASLSTRLVKFVRETFKEELEIEDVYYWTDSKVAISWIQNGKKLPCFEKGRVKEILKKSKPDQWHYVPTKENPADILSRGMSLKKLKESNLWAEGPDWLKDELKWPLKHETSFAEENSGDIETICCPVMNKENSENTFFNNLMNRYSSISKLIRVTARILKWRQMIKAKKNGEVVNGLISVNDLENAKNILIKRTQKHYFQNELDYFDNQVIKRPEIVKQLDLYKQDGIIRSKGRHEKAGVTWEERNPILLPYKSELTDLLIYEAHERVGHLGITSVVTFLRQNYWIPRIRQRAKWILGRCVVCKKVQGRSYKKPIEPQLPSIRINEARPFSVCGVDYTGALNVKGSRKKAYIVLFTCSVTRAIHLEVVDDNTTSKFLLAFRRFVARRSCPKIMMSDNSTTFTASAKFLKDIQENEDVRRNLADLSCDWKFIPSRAAWFGAIWERMIGVTKNSIKKILGKNSVDRTELITLITETEAAINNRPLTYVSTSINDYKSLSPSELIYGFRLDAPPTISTSEELRTLSRDELIENQAKYEDLKSKLWDRWRSEYLLSLRERKRNIGPNVNKVKEGDIVLIEEDIKPRMQWKMGRIMKLKESDDGLIRSVTLRTQSGEITRPIVKLYPLEVNANEEEEPEGVKIRRRAAIKALEQIKKKK